MSKTAHQTIPGEFKWNAESVDLLDCGVLTARDKEVIHFNYSYFIAYYVRETLNLLQVAPFSDQCNYCSVRTSDSLYEQTQEIEVPTKCVAIRSREAIWARKGGRMKHSDVISKASRGRVKRSQIIALLSTK